MGSILFPLLMLASLQGASDEVDAASMHLVQCYFGVIRPSPAGISAAQLDQLMARMCSAQEEAFLAVGKPRFEAKGMGADEARSHVEGLIGAIRLGLAEDAGRWRGK